MIKYTIVCPNCGKTKTFEKKFPSSRNNKFCCGGCASSYKNTVRWADPENRRRQSEKLREVNKNPELKRRQSEAAIKRWQNPEYRAKNIKATQEAHRTPEYRACISKINKMRCADPKVKAKMSKRQKELWRDPEYRQKTTEAIIEAHATEEYKAKIQAFWTPENRAIASEQSKRVAARRDMAAVAQIHWDKPGAKEEHSRKMRRLWADPHYYEMMCEKRKMACNDPDCLAQKSEQMLRLWQDDDYRQKQRESRLEYWENNPERKTQIAKFFKQLAEERWNDPIQAVQWASSMQRCPTRPELDLFAILNSNRYPYVYTGDGGLWIGGKNPDFIWPERNLIIEHFGTYWHDKSEEKPRIEHFASYGFHALIVWETELDDTKQLLIKLKEFHQSTN